jgi:hypothetical protein
VLVAGAASRSTLTSVSFVLKGELMAAPIGLGRGTLGAAGWVLAWDTRSVPNGTYDLKSVTTDSDGHRATSSGVTITVHNPPVARQIASSGGHIELRKTQATSEGERIRPGAATPKSPRCSKSWPP